MSELSKAYEPGLVEDKWYSWWIAQGIFHADPASPKPGYSMVIPPPNVTGVLTLGHVLNNTIQDILARHARQAGHEVLWLPGTDHAGIATQTVVERKLRKEEKKTRHDLGRGEFLQRVWEWKEKHGGIIIKQLKKLGCSCDWERERFTMDEAYARKVQEVFVDLHGKGLIYRGKRMVNWCPVSLTALSDEEVIPKPQKGYLYHFQVEIVERPGTFLEIATTRPETIMGDTAVAVNPKDPRYRDFIGLHVRRPLPLDDPAVIPVIGDDAVEFEFGTGVLKVTPAHDKTDYEIGLRHNLPVIDILNPDGTLNELAGGDFAGLDRFEARVEAVDKLRELGILVKEEPHENHVGFSERADVPIEPRLSEQWFLKYPKTAEARAAVRDHLIRFFPDRWEKVYDHWLENIQDWCISRQLWWGHRIPVWYSGNMECGTRNEEVISAADGGTTHSESPIPNSQFRVSIESPGEGWVQDADVLDTWFSSWLWAHGTMDAAALKKFYPTSALVTGPDIIFFWVARMIMAGLEYTGEIPFRSVYFTGIIRDRQGRKMSKSLGNSPDPLDLIAKYGADGLRFGLLRIAPQGQDIKFDEQQVVEGRNFCNKLWNACRFRLMQGAVDPAADPSKHDLSIFARDLLAKLDATISRVSEGYESFRFSDIAQALYDFVWGDFCDRFIEAAKADFDSPRRAGTLATMDFTIQRILKLLHPYTPFITEELWSGLGFGQQSLMQSPWPKAGGAAPEARADSVYAAVSRARNLRATYNVPSNKRLAWQFTPAADWVGDALPALSLFLHAGSLTLCEKAPAGFAACPTDIGILYLPLDGVVDASAERRRLQGEIGKAEAEIGKVARKLSSDSFVDNAPDAVVAEHRRRQQDWLSRLAELQTALRALG
ncbi:MAG: valine--tRNA ligase [Terrimicrobiaceae bacterium]|nr:valine--tRNA ligase [Terrimicrobiaceae bacterium]